MRKLILFGAGHVGVSALDWYGKENVAFFVDNNQKLKDKFVHGIRVIDFGKLKRIHADYDVIISVSQSNMVRQIKELLDNENIPYTVHADKVKKTHPPINYYYTPPTFVQIRLELTNLCGCKCFMCPHDKQTRPLGEMSKGDLQTILSRLQYIEYPIEVHLHGFGEALLAHDLPQKIEIVSKSNTNFCPTIVTTLAYDLSEEFFENILAGGLKKIMCSFYAYTEHDYRLVHGNTRFQQACHNLAVLSKLKDKYDFELSVKVCDFETLPEGIDKSSYKRARERFLDKLAKNNNCKVLRLQELHNFGNSMSKLTYYNQMLPCSVAWGKRRAILQVDWQGNVIPCCFDYNSTFKFGNLVRESLTEVFGSQARHKFLQHILHGDNIPMCKGCPQ